MVSRRQKVQKKEKNKLILAQNSKVKCLTRNNWQRILLYQYEINHAVNVL